MKLLHINMARCVWLFPTRDLNPTGSVLGQPALDAVGGRYAFGAVPTHAMALQAQKDNLPIEFSGGSFGRGKTAIEVNLKVYGDGLVTETRASTSDSEEFLEDFLAWVPDGLGLPKVPIVPRQKLYASEIVVSLDRSLSFINPKLEALCNDLARAIEVDRIKKIDIGALNFLIDPADGVALTPFRVERVVDAPFAENRYFSQAPVSTARHLKLIGDIEELMT